MANNRALAKARKDKDDEFYTQIADIERELKNYKDYFKGATIFCNCDDPEWSNFWRYFHLNFEFFGLKKLISTHYDPIKPTYKMEYEGGDDNDTKVGVITPLKTNGDFRSPECIELLKEADIIVTNPPFSLFREYATTLLEHNKKFIIIGNQNTITSKEIFPLIKDNLMWLGYNSGDMSFKVPDYYEPRKVRFWVDENGQKWRSMGTICWVTNLDIKKRHERLDLVEHYSPEKYPKFDNYDVINVDKTLNIPCDYKGAMGVPITMLPRHCPEQFEILDARELGKNEKQRSKSTYLIKDADGAINGKPKYVRMVIRRKDME